MTGTDWVTLVIAIFSVLNAEHLATKYHRQPTPERFGLLVGACLFSIFTLIMAGTR